MTGLQKQPFLHFSPFSVANIDAEIKSAGVPIELFPAQVCPCLDPGRGKVLYDCSQCDQIGYLYGDAIETQALISNRSLSSDYKERGVIVTGQASAVFLSGVTVGTFYKIRSKTETVIINNDVLTKGSTFLDGTSKERVRFREVLEIENLRDLDRPYLEGVDFRLGPDNRTIQWIDGGSHPEEGTQYSLRYKTYAEYLVMHSEPVIRGLMPGFIANLHAQLQRLDAVKIEG